MKDSDTKKGDNVVKLHPDVDPDETGAAGWDPYIFSILSNRKKPYPEERRSKPRTLDASRRRALLLAKGRRHK